MMDESNLESAAGVKICIYCGEDCSDRPRVRDRQNRYACIKCAQRASKKWDKQGPLAETPDPDIVFAVEPELPEEVVPVYCAVCLRQIVTGNNICVRCNYDPNVGLTEDTLVGRKSLGAEGLICAKCGYNLRGLKAMRCPECNEHIRPRTMSERKAGRFKDEATRDAYRTPMLMLGISMGVLLPWMAAVAGPTATVEFLIQFGLSVGMGLIGLYVCSLLWLGFDAPWHLNALRLGGIYAAMDLCQFVILQVFGGSLVLQLLLALIFLRVYAEMLDLTWIDVLGLWVVLMIINVGIALVLFSSGW